MKTEQISRLLDCQLPKPLKLVLNLTSELEFQLLSKVQRLSLVSRPFLKIAQKLGMEEEEVLKICEKLLNENVIRRFGVSVAHRKIGFSANPMTALKVPEEEIDKIGMQISSEVGVSHCYARTGFKYNLFFMIHGKSKSEAIERVKAIVSKTRVTNFEILFSIREFKKIPFELQN